MSDDNLLAEQVDRLLADRVDAKLIAAAEAGSWPTALWDELVAMGLTLALVPEEQDGAGLGWAEAGTIFTALGRHAAPVPLGETMLAAWALAAAGIAVPDGVLSLALPDEAVPWGEQAAHVVAIDETELRLLATPQGTAQRTIGRDPRSHLDLTGCKAISTGNLPGGVARLNALAAIMRAAQMAGAMRRILELCLEYANVRSQFGRPIGKFQAVQHMIAVLATETAAAEVAAAIGLRAAGQADPALGAGIAKTRTGMAAASVAALAHQVHAAIGVTDEYSLHYFTRRLWQWRSEFGSEHAWAQRIGRSARAAGGAGLWPLITRGS